MTMKLHSKPDNMKTKDYRVIIYSWKTILVDRLLSFNNIYEAQTYALGLYEGFRLCEKEPTGLSTKVIKKSKNH